MAPDGDEVWAFRSEPLFLKGMSDFKSKHIPPPRWLPLVRSGSFLSPGPSNSKQGNVAGSHSAVFSNEGDEPSRKPSTHQHRVCALGSWLRWPLIYPCILPPLPVLPALRCAVERMQSSERMLERRNWRPLALRCRGGQHCLSHALAFPPQVVDYMMLPMIATCLLASSVNIQVEKIDSGNKGTRVQLDFSGKKHACPYAIHYVLQIRLRSKSLLRTRPTSSPKRRRTSRSRSWSRVTHGVAAEAAAALPRPRHDRRRRLCRRPPHRRRRPVRISMPRGSPQLLILSCSASASQQTSQRGAHSTARPSPFSPAPAPAPPPHRANGPTRRPSSPTSRRRARSSQAVTSASPRPPSGR